MQKKTNNSGITLIALIITIIVMLILVAITVNTAVKTGIFDHAKDATGQWADEQKKEGELGNGPIEINGKTYNSIDEYVGKTNDGRVEPENIADWEYIIEEDGTVTITAYKGLDTEVVVPNYINGKPVKKLISKIGSTSNTIWDSSICSDEHQMYWKVQETITKVIISNGIEEIESYTFAASKALREVIIPSSVKKIGYMAFANCNNLTSIYIPKSVISLGNSAFTVYNSDDVWNKTINVEYEENEIPEGWESYWNDGWKNGTITVNYGVSR